MEKPSMERRKGFVGKGKNTRALCCVWIRFIRFQAFLSTCFKPGHAQICSGEQMLSYQEIREHLPYQESLNWSLSPLD